MAEAGVAPQLLYCRLLDGETDARNGVLGSILAKDRALCSFGLILGGGRLNEVWADRSRTDLGTKSPVHGRHSVGYVRQ